MSEGALVTNFAAGDLVLLQVIVFVFPIYICWVSVVLFLFYPLLFLLWF